MIWEVRFSAKQAGQWPPWGWHGPTVPEQVMRSHPVAVSGVCHKYGDLSSRLQQWGKVREARKSGRPGNQWMGLQSVGTWLGMGIAAAQLPQGPRVLITAATERSCQQRSLRPHSLGYSWPWAQAEIQQFSKCVMPVSNQITCKSGQQLTFNGQQGNEKQGIRPESLCLAAVSWALESSSLNWELLLELFVSTSHSQEKQ